MSIDKTFPHNNKHNKPTDVTDTPKTSTEVESVVKTTLVEQIPTDVTPVTEVNKPDQVTLTDINSGKHISPQVRKFIDLVATGYTPVKAYRGAYPMFKEKSYPHTHRCATLLMRQQGIPELVQSRKETLARLARLSEEKIEHLLTEGHSERVLSEVAMFIFDHANGKALQRSEVTSKSVSVSIDLTSVTD